MPKSTKLSISVPTDLLVLARSSYLQAPDEPLSNFFTRILREALVARDQHADQAYPPTPEEQTLLQAWSRANDQDFESEEQPHRAQLA